MSKYTVANNVPFAFSERAKATLAQPDLGAFGGFSLSIEVTGYWSDVITIYIDRDWRFERGVEKPVHSWKARVSHSSGGTDDGEGVDPLTAELYFAAGLEFAVRQARALEARFPEFEARAQARYAEERRQREAEKAEQQAKVDADAPLGEGRARAILDAAISTRKLAGSRWDQRADMCINVLPRGSDAPTPLYVGLSRNDAGLLRLQGRTVSRREALAYLAAASARTQPAVTVG